VSARLGTELCGERAATGQQNRAVVKRRGRKASVDDVARREAVGPNFGQNVLMIKARLGPL
jgi:hypothetical protein